MRRLHHVPDDAVVDEQASELPACIEDGGLGMIEERVAYLRAIEPASVAR